jgi:transcriptional regulator with XRE-family HTH domain
MTISASAGIVPGRNACVYPEMDFGTLGKRLRALREEAGLSREKLADRAREAGHAGVRAGQIHKYETGENAMMEADRAVALAEALSTDVRWLINGDPPGGLGSAFETFERTVAPTLNPPMTIAERGRLVWARFRNPTAERYLETLLRERDARSPEAEAASREATAAAKAKASAAGVKPIRRGGR